MLRSAHQRLALLAACLAAGTALGDVFALSADQLPDFVRQERERVDLLLAQDPLPVDEVARQNLSMTGAAEVLCDGRDIDLGWLLTARASGNRTELVRAWDKLKAWEATLAEPVPAVDPGRVRATAAAILTDPAYRPVKTSSWIDPWLPYVERFFDLLFAPFTHRRRDAGLWRSVLDGLVYLGLLAVLTTGLVKLGRRRVGRATTDEAGEGLAVRQLRTADGWREEARSRAAAGHLAEALSLSHLALLVRLDELGRLPFQPWLTDRELVDAASDDAELAEVLRLFAATAERVVYSGRPCAPEELQACQTSMDRLWRPQ